jgi:hypothetical protein
MSSLEQLGSEKYVRLTTFRKDGRALLGSRLRRGVHGTVAVLLEPAG